MGIWDTLRGGSRTPVAEIYAPPPEVDDLRTGFETLLPPGGVTSDDSARREASPRRKAMDDLASAYMTCPWVSTSADKVARKATAGGLILVPKDSSVDSTRRPREILLLDELMRNTNGREDMQQLVRSAIVDTQVFGDAFIEVGSLMDTIVALWSQDAATTNVRADDHGNILGWDQFVDQGRHARFEPGEIIQISLDNVRGGLYGVSPTQKLTLSITTWLFAQACIKEFYRKGAPPQIAVDFGSGSKEGVRARWWTQYQTRHLSPRNIGQPLITAVRTDGGPPPIMELNARSIEYMIKVAAIERDNIVSGFGLSPADVGIIESGNLGGGTGEAQAKNTQYDTIKPIQGLFLEKFNYRLLTCQGIDDWEFRFNEVDFRDSKTIEEIADLRIKNGTWTINRARDEIGEEPVDGGDDAIIVDRQGIVRVSDIAANAEATLAAQKAAAFAPTVPQGPVDEPPPGSGVTKEGLGEAREMAQAWASTFREQLRLFND